ITIKKQNHEESSRRILAHTTIDFNKLDFVKLLNQLNDYSCLQNDNKANIGHLCSIRAFHETRKASYLRLG
ncbi:MAG TPA: hypothetical protein VHB70_17440, partial [Parafilimonas sp.]|nr:hypothetical protein [Parafilimonas sp.]